MLFPENVSCIDGASAWRIACMKIMVLVIGTAAGTGQGGVSTALPGYLAALEGAGFAYKFIASHEGGSPLQKFSIYLHALAELVGSISETKSKRQTPVVYVHIGSWFSMLRKLSFVWVGKIMGAKSVCQVHSLSMDRYLRHAVGRLACRFFFAQMDRVLVLTEWWRSRLADVGVKRLDIVPNPLSESFERVAHQARVEGGSAGSGHPVKILSMARLVHGKGIDLAIQSLLYLPAQYGLTIAGSGPWQNELEAMVSSLGLSERVVFLGWVKGESRSALFETHDVFLLPSQNDSFGMGFIEAMAHGLPVVALNRGAIADVVAGGRAGFLIGQPDAVLLADALWRLAASDLRAKMGKYGKQWVLRKFSIASVSLKLSRMMSLLLNEENR